MSTMSKRIASLLLVALLLFSCAFAASARFSYINYAVAGLSIKDGTASCVADLDGYSGITTKIVTEMTLQKRVLLLFWSDEQTWTQTFNNCYGTLSKSASVSSGTYRVQATFTVYSGSSSESTTCTSGSLAY